MHCSQRFGHYAALGALLLELLVKSTTAQAALTVTKFDPVPTASPAKGLFLLARRNLPDPNFRRTLVFLIHHDATGTQGLVINRRTKIKLSEAIPQIKGAGNAQRSLYWGGPVARNQVLYLLHNDRMFDYSGLVTDDVYVSSHAKLLEKLFEEGKSQRDLRVFAGRASWTSGQLSAELARGDWHLLRADAQIVFSRDVDSLWKALIDREDPKGIMALRNQAPVEFPLRNQTQLGLFRRTFKDRNR